jgi:hypothetical protein
MNLEFDGSYSGKWFKTHRGPSSWQPFNAKPSEKLHAAKCRIGNGADEIILSPIWPIIGWEGYSTGLFNNRRT